MSLLDINSYVHPVFSKQKLQKGTMALKQTDEQIEVDEDEWRKMIEQEIGPFTIPEKSGNVLKCNLIRNRRF